MSAMQPPDQDREYDLANLGHGSILFGAGLLASAWWGVLMGSVALFLPTAGVGTLVWLSTGIWAVPLFGWAFGSLGLMRARDSAMRSTGTIPLDEDHPLRRATAQLATMIGLPVPVVGIYPDADMNAFATGSSPQKALVSFSKGLTERLPARAMLAVAAHELAHIANHDMRRMQFATSFQKSLTWYLGFSETLQGTARWVLGTIGELMVMRLSRQREYWADATAAVMVGKEAMIEALRCLDGDPVKPAAERLAYARMMIRANPASWFATHPPIAARIAALESETFIRRLPTRARRQDGE